ncbi:MAG: FHA domain-containing protein [Sphingomonas sp.]
MRHGRGSQAPHSATPLSTATRLSRRHARFTLVGGVLHLEDLGTAHGTSVDGAILRPFDPRPISAGSTVALGSRSFRLAAHAGAAASAGHYRTY